MLDSLLQYWIQKETEGKRMSKSIARVEAAGRAAGRDITGEWMPGSTRTAVEAAQACGCGVGQIVKSLIFERMDNGALVLRLRALEEPSPAIPALMTSNINISVSCAG